MADRTWAVLGALGEGLHAPLLAEQRWAGRSRRVVLARPAPDEASPASGSRSARVIAEVDRVQLTGRELAVVPFSGDLDLGQLLDEHPDGLSPRALQEIAVAVCEALEAAGCPHGSLSFEAVRVGAEGVTVVGWRGREAADHEALVDLLQESGDPPESLLDAARTGDPAVLHALDLVGEPLASYLGQVAVSPLHPHPWTGTILSEQAPAAVAPPKVRTAAIAALTLLLGWAGAWFYLSGG